jgi:hypothetical protein
MAGPLPRAIGVRSYLSYISLWQPIHIASGFGESAVRCSGLASAEASIDEFGKVQTAKRTNVKAKTAGTTRPISRNSSQGFACVPDE